MRFPWIGNGWIFTKLRRCELLPIVVRLADLAAYMVVYYNHLYLFSSLLCAFNIILAPRVVCYGSYTAVFSRPYYDPCVSLFRMCTLPRFSPRLMTHAATAVRNSEEKPSLLSEFEHLKHFTTTRCEDDAWHLVAPSVGPELTTPSSIQPQCSGVESAMDSIDQADAGYMHQGNI
jgi:hypothetical protein